VRPVRAPLPGGDRHVVLVGPAGPRRTSVGRRLARLLRRPFADADEQLELVAGRVRSRLAREEGVDVLLRREAQVLAHLLAHDVSLVIVAPVDRRVHRRSSALLARSAVVLRLRDDDARASPDQVGGECHDLADHVVDLEPFRAGLDEPGRAVAHHILQLFVTGELRGSIRVPDDVLARQPGHLADVADLGIDVEPFRTGDDSPEGAIARHIARLLEADDPRSGA
jgi:hypothetical protein